MLQRGDVTPVEILATTGDHRSPVSRERPVEVARIGQRLVGQLHREEMIWLRPLDGIGHHAKVEQAELGLVRLQEAAPDAAVDPVVLARVRVINPAGTPVGARRWRSCRPECSANSCRGQALWDSCTPSMAIRAGRSLIALPPARAQYAVAGEPVSEHGCN